MLKKKIIYNQTMKEGAKEEGTGDKGSISIRCKRVEDIRLQNNMK